MCGALNGGILALGLFFGRTEQKGLQDPHVVKCMQLTHELHNWFIKANGKHCACCRILTKEFDMSKGEHKQQCIYFTGICAAKVAQIVICLLLLLILISIRYKKLPVPPPARPLFCIYAAPMSLCIAGYVQSVTPKSAGFLLLMAAAAFILYLLAFARMLSCIKGPFYPSFAAFTFPFTISAIASMQAATCLAKLGQPLPALTVLGQAETIVAVLLTAFVIIRFSVHHSLL